MLWWGERLIDSKVDIEKIMTEIRVEIARKKEHNLYPKNLEREVEKLISLQDRGNLTVFIKEFAEISYIKHDLLNPSTRPIFGKFITLFKKVVRKTTAWYFRSITDQINNQNNNMVKILNAFHEEIDNLKREISSLNERIETEDEVVGQQKEDASNLSSAQKLV